MDEKIEFKQLKHVHEIGEEIKIIPMPKISRKFLWKSNDGQMYYGHKIYPYFSCDEKQTL